MTQIFLRPSLWRSKVVYASRNNSPCCRGRTDLGNPLFLFLKFRLTQIPVGDRTGVDGTLLRCCPCEQGWPSWLFTGVQPVKGNVGPGVPPAAGRHSHRLPAWANTGSCCCNAPVPFSLKATVQCCLLIPNKIFVKAPPSVCYFLRVDGAGRRWARGGFSLAGVRLELSPACMG